MFQGKLWLREYFSFRVREGMKLSLAAHEVSFSTTVGYCLLLVTGPRRAGPGPTGKLLAEGGLQQVGGAQRGCGHDQGGEDSPENENILFGGWRVVTWTHFH